MILRAGLRWMYGDAHYFSWDISGPMADIRLI